jgi:tetratricopeptide (TPR) repeat protein
VPTIVGYAGALAFVGRNGDALSQYTIALELEPDNLNARRSYAEFLFLEQRYSEAADQYRKIVAIDQELGIVHLQLGASLAATGDYEDAHSHLERARELGQKIPPAVQQRVDLGLRSR